VDNFKEIHGIRLEVYLNPDHEDFDSIYANPVYEKEALC